MLIPIIVAVVGLAGGGAVGYYYRKKQVEAKNKDIVQKAEQMLADTKNKSKEIIYEARNEAFKIQDEVKKEERRAQAQLNVVEERLMEKEQSRQQCASQSRQLGKLDADQQIANWLLGELNNRD